MDRPTRVAVKPVTRLLRSQVEALKAQPSLVEGLPFTLSDLEARLAEVTDAESAQQLALATLVATTDSLHRLAFQARETARLNLAHAAYRLGRKSAEVATLRGRISPRRSKKPAASKTSDAAPGATPPPAAAADSEATPA